MNDIFWLIVGFMLMFVSIITGVMVIFNLLSPQIYIIVSIVVGCISGLLIALISLLMKGVLAPMMSARMTGKTLVAILTAGKNIHLEAGKEGDGLVATDRGYFLTPTDTVYLWPNGVRGGIAYYKYGCTLKPDMIKAASILKKEKINDINQLENINNNIEKSGGDVLINLKEETP